MKLASKDLDAGGDLGLELRSKGSLLAENRPDAGLYFISLNLAVLSDPQEVETHIANMYFSA